MEEIPQYIGRAEGRYRIVRLLGQGAMGQVFEAVQTNLSRRVALKLIRPGQFAQPETRRRFIDEARILGKLSHPNVVTLFDADLSDSEAPFLVMEYIDGRPLRGMLQERERLPVTEVLQIAQGLLAGLEYLHASGVVHRDLKPENVLMEGGRVPKLVDFGLARALGTGRVTAEGFMVGTPLFMSPEQMAGSEGTPQSDLYALGMTLFHMLTSAYPVPLERGFSLLTHKLALDEKAIGAKMGGTPHWLVSAIAGCLAPATQDRFQSVEELRKVLAPPRRTSRTSAPRAAARGGPSGTRAQARGSGRRTVPRATWRLGLVALPAIAALAFSMRPAPMATQPEYAPAGLAVEPLAGAARVTWRSQQPYRSVVVSGESRHATGEATRVHSVVVQQVPWARAPEASCLLPDGSLSPPFRLEALPVAVRPAITPLGTAYSVALDLPEPAGLTLSLSAGGGVPAMRWSPLALTHRLELPVLAPGVEHSLEVLSSGGGTVPARVGPIRLEACDQEAKRIARSVLGMGFGTLSKQLMVAHSERRGPDELAALLRKALEEIGWSRLHRERSELFRWALGAENTDQNLGGYVNRSLDRVQLVDQAALFLGFRFDSGVRELKGEIAVCQLGFPEGGRRFEHLLEKPEGLLPGDLQAIWKATNGVEANSELLFAIELPAAISWSESHLSLQLETARPEGLLYVEVNSTHPGDERQLLFVYPEIGTRDSSTWVTQRFDPRWLVPGRNRFVVTFRALPGTLATGAWLRGVRLTVM